MSASTTITASSRLTPTRWWWFAIPSSIVLLGAVVPVIYLVMRAGEAPWDTVPEMVFRARHGWLLLNTAGLAVAVLALCTLIALPLAWLTARSDLPGKRFITLLGVMPLAIPGYVMAYAMLAASGPSGMTAQLLGFTLPRPSGFYGAMIALSLCLFPYLFLNLRAAFLGIDPALVESARSLGHSPASAFFRVTLPQLRPAYQAGALLIALHVLGDFGVVSLMHFETFSLALYQNYESYDRVYVAWLALIMLAITAVLLAAEARLLRNLWLHRVGTGAPRASKRHRLGAWTVAGYGYAGALALVAVVLPIATIVYWAVRPSAGAIDWADLFEALSASLSASAPAAVLATALALPVVYLSVRRPTRSSRALERMAYFSYATPPLAFGLAVIVFSLRATPWLYQTLALLIAAYTIHFVAEAIGPIRSALYQSPKRLEEAGRSLGHGPIDTFRRVTFPLIRRGLLLAVVLVFLSAMKELPLTLMLAPLDFTTLSMNVWDKTTEALFADAAPYALALIVISSGFVAVLGAGAKLATRTRQDKRTASSH